MDGNSTAPLAMIAIGAIQPKPLVCCRPEGDIPARRPEQSFSQILPKMQSAWDSDVVGDLTTLDVTENTETVGCLLARHMDFPQCRLNKFTLVGCGDVDVNMDDVFISAVAEVIEPFSIRAVAVAIRYECTPCRARIECIHCQADFVPLGIIHDWVEHIATFHSRLIVTLDHMEKLPRSTRRNDRLWRIAAGSIGSRSVVSLIAFLLKLESKSPTAEV
nr:hypothetical protein [Rhizobium sp. M1]